MKESGGLYYQLPLTAPIVDKMLTEIGNIDERRMCCGSNLSIHVVISNLREKAL